ncbi:MAG: NAD(P)H-hydrate dehydratase [Jatrophihabitans sp.]
MRGVWPAEAIREAERQALAHTPEGALMQRAATAVAVTATQLLRGRTGGGYGRRVGVLVGSGSNGGDALYAGARLAAAGVVVRAVLLAPDRVHRAGLRALRAAGGRVLDADLAEAWMTTADLVIDGIVGLGGKPGLRGAAVELADTLVQTGVPVVAVDLPSGIDGDTGAVPQRAIAATTTVTFGGLKPGLLIGPGADHAGDVRFVDLGFDEYLAEPELQVLEAADVVDLLGVPGPEDDKYTRGVVGVVAGGPEYGGAAVLCTGGAVQAGAGMVRYAGAAPDAVRTAWPQVVVQDDVPSAGRVQAWVVGPGLGTGDAARESLRQVLAEDVPVLVDADAITLLAGADFAGALAARTQPTVLTPHDREFERLFGAVGDDRVGAARMATADSGAVVLLKGNTTVVAGPAGPAYLNPTGTPWLATAGSGDVLSGIIGTLLASGLPAELAAACGAYLHGVAGQLAAADGPPSAADVLAAVRSARRHLQ